ncbi:MAG: NRDE family protein [Acidobacteria bacterium]|nr:NRDE family protein [Acidobacteriota bacterium]
MCVIYFAVDAHRELPLVLAANRDEFYERPTAAAAIWDDAPDVFAGRDLASGGTWLGVTTGGRFAAVTNYRDPSAPRGKLSRGMLTTDFLKSGEPPLDYLRHLASRPDDYSGYNLIVGAIRERTEVGYYSDRGGEPRLLTPGIYGLSNHLLDTPWPKVLRGRARFAELIETGEIAPDAYLDILADTATAPDADLPSTGIPLEAERALSAIFIRTPGYGTRSSSLLTIGRDRRAILTEKVWV